MVVNFEDRTPKFSPCLCPTPEVSRYVTRISVAVFTCRAHIQVPGEARWLECNQRQLFVASCSDSLSLSLEQGRYSQPATHKCTAGPAHCSLVFCTSQLLNLPFHLECFWLHIFYIPSLLREMDATVTELTGSRAHIDSFAIRLKGKVIKTLGYQPWICLESLKL
jgi:hypothetical protein